MSGNVVVCGTTDTGTKDFQQILSDQGYLKIIPMLWNPSTLAYQRATGGLSGTATQVEVTNFPSNQTVNGTVTANQGGTWTVDTSSKAVVNAANSTTTTLGVGGNFTGTAIDMLNYSTIRVSIFSDKPSATNGFGIDFSNDGTNWDFPKRSTYSDTTEGETIVFNRVARYARINYTNGGVAQTVFRLQTLVVPNSTEFVRHFMSDVPEDSDTGIMVQAAIVGHTTAGGAGWVPVKVTPSGAMTAAATINNIAGAQINPSSSDVVQPVSGTVTATPPAPTFFSSTAAMAAGSTVTSTVFDTVNGQSWISFSAFSAVSLLVYFDESADNVNWYSTDAYTVPTGGANYSSHKSSARYARVRFVCGANPNIGGAGQLLLAATQNFTANETDTSIVDSSGNAMGVNGQFTTKISDGSYTAAVTSQGELNVDSDDLNQLVMLQYQMLQELRAMRLAIAGFSGYYVEPEDLDGPWVQ